MKRFFTILIVLLMIAGGLYGAWTALEFFDNVRLNYREELARSQLLNQNAQQRITDLIAENTELRSELEELRNLPAFAAQVMNIEVLEEDEEYVGYQTDTE
ncbi:MAG: hypothetical protein FWE04_00155 [Oscillospiraceae bacterium]|nr:hypothetical protein [Oscillospiraceae bacterium]